MSPIARPVTETPRPGDVPLWEHPEWAARFPWLVQGMTAAGAGARPFDLALFGEGRPAEVMERWWALGHAVGAFRIAHGHQVHGPTVRVHGEGGEGLHVSPRTDGHVTRTPGVLLAVSAADCVPISLVGESPRAVALLHGGWRGIAAGILERGIETLRGRLSVKAGDLSLHLGPAICGSCYEVGPEVHRGLGLVEPAGPQPVDLRALLCARAQRAGVPADRITSSTWCTRCGEGTPFFSHRGGRAERQVAVLGIAAT